MATKLLVIEVAVKPAAYLVVWVLQIQKRRWSDGIQGIYSTLDMRGSGLNVSSNGLALTDRQP